MTLVIDNLEKRGLVYRVQDAQDRRYLKIHLTPQGQELVSRVFPCHAAIAEKVFAVLRKDEQEQLSRLLKKLGCSESLAPSLIRGRGVVAKNPRHFREGGNPESD